MKSKDNKKKDGLPKTNTPISPEKQGDFKDQEEREEWHKMAGEKFLQALNHKEEKNK